MRDALLERFPGWSLAHWCVTVFAVSFLATAMLPAGVLKDRTVPMGGENVRVARSLAKSGEFANPFASVKTGTTAHVAPAYPFLYSLALRAFGTGYPALLILWTCNLGFLALQMALLPWISYRLGLGVFSGVVAAGLGTFSLHSEVDTAWECFLAGALLALAFLATEKCFGGAASENMEGVRGTVVLAAGMLWGALILTNPVTMALLVAWPVCWMMRRASGERGLAMARWAMVAGIALVIVAPWIARNYGRFGALIFVRDNLGLELAVSNNDCAAATIAQNIRSGCHGRTHPNGNAAIAAEILAEGEYRFNQGEMREAMAWIGDHRVTFLRLTAQRLRQFWLPDLENWWETTTVWMTTLLSAVGLWVMARRNATAARVVACTWILFPLIYYVVQAEPRYGYPIYWTTSLAAGCALAQMFGRFGKGARAGMS